MNRRLMILWLMLGILMLQMACESPVGPGEEAQGTTRIHGVVIRNDNLSVVPDVVVYDITGRPIDTTKSDGKFVLTYQLTSPYVGKIIAKRQGFGDDTANVSLVPGRDTSLVMRIKATASSPATGGTGKAANIVLLSTTEEVTISVRGTGGNETASMLFEVRDSLGLPVGGANKVQVTFAIQGGPGGGEYLYPLTSFTDALTGRVTTKITSGTKAGVVQVFASATVDNNTIKSRPVRVLIAGGFPEAGRFSLSTEKLNLPAVYDNIKSLMTAAVVDKYGNPVNNVAVYFSTTAGDIDAGGLTDNTGRVTSTLRTSGTRPTGGIATVTAKTIGDSGITISKSIPIVFSMASQIVAPQASFVIADSGLYDFTYKVQDINGMPLTAGTTVRVGVTGDPASELKVEGDVDVTIPDTQDPKYTNFSARIRDSKLGGASGNITVSINVTSLNGNIIHKFNGTLLSSGGDVIVVPPSAREPAQIAFGGVSTNAIDVAGIGGIENAVITYIVKDSLGKPIDEKKRVYARFSISFFPNSYVGGGTPPRVIPGADSSDNSGQLRASIVSGTQAGVVQLVARVDLPNGNVLTSEPVKVTVRAGDPTQSHFTFYTDAFVFATTPELKYPRFFVQLADTFSNPVALGTAVYFHSWAGAIQANTNTDIDGRGVVSFLGGNPLPTNAGSASAGRPTYYQREGVFWVVSQTSGKNGKKIIDSLRVAWAVGPISVTGIPTTALDIPRAGTSAPVNISVRDARGNPLPVGTKISMKIEFTSDVSGIKFGSSGDLSTDEPFVQPNGPWVVDPGPRVTDFNFRISDLSTAGGATIGQTIIVKITIEAPNMGPPFTVSFSGRVL